MRVGCPIRRSRDQRLLASPPGLSQRATPFIASQCQGIHQMPLLRSFPDTASAASDKTRHSQGQKPPPGSPIRVNNDCLPCVTLTLVKTLYPRGGRTFPQEPSAISCQPSANETPASVTLSSPCQRTHRQCRRIAGKLCFHDRRANRVSARCRIRRRAAAPPRVRSLS